MKRLLLVFAILLALWQPEGSFVADAKPQIGLSIGANDFPGVFINWLKGCSSPIYNGKGNLQMLDSDMYPNAAPIPEGASIFCAITQWPTNYTGTWEWFFSGKGQPQLAFSNVTVVSNPASNPVVPHAHTCSFSANTLKGTDCDVIISFKGSPAAAHVFTAGTYSNFGNEGLIRTSDKAAYLAGHVYTPEWISLLRSSGALYLRTMGMSFPTPQNIANETAWRYRIPRTAFSYRLPYYPPNIWAGIDPIHTDNYILRGYHDMPSQWTDGEIFQFKASNSANAAISIRAAAADSSSANCGGREGCVQFTVNSTSTLTSGETVLVMNAYGQTRGKTAQAPQPYVITVIDNAHVDLRGTAYHASWSGKGTITTTTINVGNRGTKFAVTESVLGAPNIRSNIIETCHFDGLLDVLLCSNYGINAGLPPEAQVEMANEANISLWANIPPFWQEEDVASWTRYINSTLKDGLNFYAELANENWNYSFYAQNWTQRGFAIGLSQSSNQALYSYIGLRYRQLMPSVIYNWKRPRSQLHIVGGAQAYGNPSQFATFEFSGAALCGVSCGNPSYQRAVGVDYNIAPDRPKDYIDDYAIASYWNGAQESGNVGTLTQLKGIITAASNFVSGQTADAFNFIYNDNFDGTCGGCSGEAFTISKFETNQAANWNLLAENDGKSLISYEGGWSSYGPSASYLASIGDNHAQTDAININNLLVAFRSSNKFFSLYSYQNRRWFANSRVVGNSQLEVQGFGSVPANRQYWGLLERSIFPAVPYQNYWALQKINVDSP